MSNERNFYAVTQDISNAPLKDHLMHGYEEKMDFEIALRQLARRWKDRIGERIGERHGFFLLRFHDTPGGKPDEAWLPHYLLKPIPKPESRKKPNAENDLDQAFGFD